METIELPDGLIRNLSPPSEENKFVLMDFILLVTKVLWLLPLIVKDIVVEVIRIIFPPAKKSLAGQVALVTGGGRGLGRGLALGLAREGCKVAIVDVNISNARGTANDIVDAGGLAKAYQCNVANPAAIKELRKAVTSDLGPVDILVNNAAIIYGGDLLEDCEECDIKAVMDVNLMSHFWMIREFIPTMKERNSGHIVAIGSLASYMTGEKGSAYMASKWGVRALMGVVRAELGLRPHNNVKTTTVYPYFINTSKDYLDDWVMSIPPLSIEDVADATITGVLRNRVSVFVPSLYGHFAGFCGMLPLRSYDRIKKVLAIDVKPFKKEKGNQNESIGIKKGQ